MSYQWKNGSGDNVGSGASYTTSVAGSYYCAVTGGCGVVNSGTATLTLWPLPMGSISGGGTVCAGSTAPVTLSFGGGSGSGYVYRLNTDDSDQWATTRDLTAGTYTLAYLRDSRSCEATSRDGSATVGTTELTISSGSIGQSVAEVYTNGAFSLTNGDSASSTCSAGITYEWFRNDESVGNNAVTLDQSGLANGTYTYYRKAKLSNGQSANSNSVSVTVKSLIFDGLEWALEDAPGGKAYTWDQAMAYCPSIGMRLPTAAEMNTCPDRNDIGVVDHSYYWSSSQYNSTSAYYWVWLTKNWFTTNSRKDLEFCVRCVKFTFPTISFGGFDWTTEDAPGGAAYTWDQAKAYCSDIGMRLPTRGEIMYLPNNNDMGVVTGNNYWSATERNETTAYYWNWLDSEWNASNDFIKSGQNHVRCVQFTVPKLPSVSFGGFKWAAEDAPGGAAYTWEQAKAYCSDNGRRLPMGREIEPLPKSNGLGVVTGGKYWSLTAGKNPYASGWYWSGSGHWTGGYDRSTLFRVRCVDSPTISFGASWAAEDAPDGAAYTWEQAKAYCSDIGMWLPSKDVIQSLPKSNGMDVSGSEVYWANAGFGKSYAYFWSGSGWGSGDINVSNLYRVRCIK